MKNLENTIFQEPAVDLEINFSAPKAKAPLRFWEIEGFFKCPVVGMCLTLAEQKRMLKKTKLSKKNTSPFEIHEAIVACSESENLVSRRVDRLLHRKFGNETDELLELDHAAFMEHFKEADAAGDHTTALWAAAVHPDLPLTQKRVIFGQVHMSMHWSGEQRLKMNRKLSDQRGRLEEMRRCNKAVAQKKHDLEEENQQLRRAHADLKTSLAEAEKEMGRMRKALVHPAPAVDVEKLAKENQFLKKELEALYEAHHRQQRQVEALKEKNRQLASQLGHQAELNRRFRQQAQPLIAEMAAKSRCDESCPVFDLCQKRILIVGGMSRMESLYRELIETSGGIFEYHDGYMKKGARQLESRLKRADVVLCPVNCNSHNACTVVKSLAKKHDKTVHMLANSSLKAVSQAIWGSGDGRHMVN
jgi:hypothetical protein